MKTFNIYKHPTLGLQAVKVGFAWPGFFFGIIWMLVCRLWLHSAVVFGVAILLSLPLVNVDQETGAVINLVMTLGFAIFIGASGNQWRRGNLLKRGFQEVSTVEAENKDAALGMFCDSHVNA